MYILDKINEEQQARQRKLSFDERFDIIDSIVREMAKGNKLNFLLSDGRYLYVHSNCKETLYYLEKEDVTLFSTRPLSDENWQLVEFATLLAYKNGRLVKTGTTHNNEYVENKEAIKFLYQIFSDL